MRRKPRFGEVYRWREGNAESNVVMFIATDERENHQCITIESGGTGTSVGWQTPWSLNPRSWEKIRDDKE